MGALARAEIAVCLLFASGCGGSIADLPTWVGFAEDDDDALVLLAVTPSASVVVAAGRIEHDGWRARGPTSRAELSAKDGFVLAKVSPTQDEHAFAVVEARPESCARLGQEFSPTQGSAFWSVASPSSVATAAAPSTAESDRACPAYAPAGEAQLPVFRATAGRVTYVGGIRLGASKGLEADGPPGKIAVGATSPDDLEAARQFLAKRYPKVMARVVPRPLEMMRPSK